MTTSNPYMQDEHRGAWQRGYDGAPCVAAGTAPEWIRLAHRRGAEDRQRDDGSKATPRTIETERVAFEAYYGPMGFDLTRDVMDCEGVEPWTEYKDTPTGFAWSGWLARSGAEL